VERVAQGGLVQRGGGVVHGENQKALGGLARLPVDARDGFAWKELPHRVPAEGDDDARLQDLEVAEKPGVARRYLFWERVAILRWPVPDHIGDEDGPPVEPDAGEKLVEELPGGADKRLALEVLVITGGLAEKEDP